MKNIWKTIWIIIIILFLILSIYNLIQGNYKDLIISLLTVIIPGFILLIIPKIKK